MGIKSVGKRLRLRWAKKLLHAKYFVAMTDKEAMIALDAADPNEMHDAVALAAQAAELRAFYDKLGALLHQHDIILRALSKEADEKSNPVNRARTSTKASTRKVPTKVRSNTSKKAKV